MRRGDEASARTSLASSPPAHPASTKQDDLVAGHVHWGNHSHQPCRTRDAGRPPRRRRAVRLARGVVARLGPAATAHDQGRRPPRRRRRLRQSVRLHSRTQLEVSRPADLLLLPSSSPLVVLARPRPSSFLLLPRRAVHVGLPPQGLPRRQVGRPRLAQQGQLARPQPLPPGRRPARPPARGLRRRPVVPQHGRPVEPPPLRRPALVRAGLLLERARLLDDRRRVPEAGRRRGHQGASPLPPRDVRRRPPRRQPRRRLRGRPPPPRPRGPAHQGPPPAHDRLCRGAHPRARARRGPLRGPVRRDRPFFGPQARYVVASSLLLSTLSRDVDVDAFLPLLQPSSHARRLLRCPSSPRARLGRTTSSRPRPRTRRRSPSGPTASSPPRARRTRRSRSSSSARRRRRPSRPRRRRRTRRSSSSCATLRRAASAAHRAPTSSRRSGRGTRRWAGT